MDVNRKQLKPVKCDEDEIFAKERKTRKDRGRIETILNPFTSEIY